VGGSWGARDYTPVRLMKRKWCVVCGVWCVVCGVWCVVCGVWCVVCGVWCVVCDAWCVVSDAWCVVCGAWAAHTGHVEFEVNEALQSGTCVGVLGAFNPDQQRVVGRTSGTLAPAVSISGHM
jgi:hypothetical protein